MGTTAIADRRDPSAPRRPFRGTVELAGADERDGYQADAIDLSIGGMSVRAGLLPDVGEQVQCRFTLEDGLPVDTSGEVVWARDRGERAGAFGVKFLSLPSTAREAIRANLHSLEADAPSARPRKREEGKVRLFLQGMEAPLRARVRSRAPGALVLGSDLGFLRLGDKVEVDGKDERSSGVIEAVEVEIDPGTGVPRLVLTVTIEGEERAAPAAPVSAKAAAPAVSEPATKAREQAPEADAPPVRRAEVPEAVRPTRPAAHATEVLPPTRAAASDHGDEDAQDEALSDDQDDDAHEGESRTPAWLSGSLTAVGGAFQRFAAWSGPALRRAGEASSRVVTSAREKLQTGRGEVSEGAPTARAGLRRQHADAPAGIAVPKSRRAVLVYAAVASALAVVIVAVASLGGPAPRPPRPQVAVTPTTEPAPELPSPAPTPESVGTDPLPVEPEGRTVTARGALPPDLAGASVSRSTEVETPTVVDHPVRAPRAAVVRRELPAVRPAPQTRVLAQAPHPAIERAHPRAQATPSSVTAPTGAPTAVFGNPAVRRGTTLRLRLDGPIDRINGVGVRGTSIVIRVPGRRSLDVAAPLVSQDPRLLGAGVYNRPTGAELVLRFREPAPPFVARGRSGNTLEIVLAPPPAPASHASASARRAAR